MKNWGEFVRTLGFALWLAAAYCCALFLAWSLLQTLRIRVPFPYGAHLLFLLLSLAVFALAIYDVRVRGGRELRAALEFFVFVVCIGLGLLAVTRLLEPGCVVECRAWPFRPFAVPEVYGLLVVHVPAVVAYYLSRRRPEQLPPLPEAVLTGTLWAGILLHAITTIHIGKNWSWTLWLPLTFPLASPLFNALLLAAEIRARLARRAGELTRERDARSVRALAALPVLLGAWIVIDGLLFGRVDAAWRTFTNTCDYTFSSLPLQHERVDCHYLCTVAARGHGWLVRPERVGQRRGVAIVVNRQLAVANAFEDLLIARAPRCARWCRRQYDRWGLPLSRCIRHPLASDAVYLLMKPAEWAFYLILLLFDPNNPEARIARMYRS